VILYPLSRRETIVVWSFLTIAAVASAVVVGAMCWGSLTL